LLEQYNQLREASIIGQPISSAAALFDGDIEDDKPATSAMQEADEKMH